MPAEGVRLRHVGHLPVQRKRPTERMLDVGLVIIPGSDLLSHRVASAVPSAVAGLTTVFGMGTGVALLL